MFKLHSCATEALLRFSDPQRSFVAIVAAYDCACAIVFGIHPRPSCSSCKPHTEHDISNFHPPSLVILLPQIRSWSRWFNRILKDGAQEHSKMFLCSIFLLNHLDQNQYVLLLCMACLLGFFQSFFPVGLFTSVFFPRGCRAAAS